MITNLEIDCYRGIKTLDLSGLNRVNIFVGKNGSGKTSVMEAIILAGRVDPSTHETLGLSREMKNRGEMIKTAFHRRDYKQPIKISYSEEDGEEVFLTIDSISNSEASGIISSSPMIEDKDTESLSAPSLYGVKHAQSKSGRKSILKWSLALHHNHFHKNNPSQAVLKKPVFFIHARKSSSLKETAKMLSEIANDFEKENELFDLLRLIKPSLRRIRISYDNEIMVDFNDSPSMPLNALGDGFSRLTLIMTGVFSTKSNVLVVDEIDSGLHYSVMESLWKGLLALATKHNKQIFCATHNDEMLRATLSAFADDKEALRIYRLTNKDGFANAQKYDYDLYRDTEIIGMTVR